MRECCKMEKSRTIVNLKRIKSIEDVKEGQWLDDKGVFYLVKSVISSRDERNFDILGYRREKKDMDSVVSRRFQYRDGKLQNAFLEAPNYRQGAYKELLNAGL